MDQTGPGRQALTPFKTAWWGTDLGRYRSCDSTYCLYPYESLPPLPPLDGSLTWLGALPSDVDQQMEAHRNAPDERGTLAHIREAADRLGLALPGAFLRLMASAELQDRIPSCTACYFQLSEQITPCPGSEQGYIVRFLNDQQDVLAWYLYLTPAGESCVVVSPYELDGVEEQADAQQSADEREQRIHAIGANTRVCARSFEEFIYRFWLENVLWFKLSDGSQAASLTMEEQRYLAHYEQQGAS
jgi:hypothetical protein